MPPPADHECIERCDAAIATDIGGGERHGVARGGTACCNVGAIVASAEVGLPSELRSPFVAGCRSTAASAGSGR
ncbi:MAG: hypothetical protein U9Q68_05850 [Euryarchaeota archaeon]|nr:hypothetical protein [Euryarchaeota archaeon]